MLDIIAPDHFLGYEYRIPIPDLVHLRTLMPHWVELALNSNVNRS